jgi:hypothetical protein
MSENTGSELSAYPNPSDGIVNFEIENQTITKIIISDINGKEIISSNLERYIDLSNFAPGVYFAKISTDQNTYVARIIRE